MLNPDELGLINKNGFVVTSLGLDDGRLRRMEEIFWSMRDSLEHYSGWSYIGIFRKNSEYLNFLNQTTVAKIGRQLLGEEIDLYWDSVVIKPAHKGKSFSWHQDSGLVQTDPLVYFTFWIPFHPTTIENGCLWVKPGSHRLGLLNHTSVKVSDEVYPGKGIANFDATGEIPVEMQAGELLIFHSLLAHRSGPNKSDRDRAALAFGLHRRGYREVNVPSHIKPLPGLPI